MRIEDVTLWTRGARHDGTLNLKPHHMVFSWHPPPPPDSPESARPPREKELWITFPMVSYCVYRPTPPQSHQQPSIRIQCRDFKFFAFHFLGENKAREAYERIRSSSCKIGRLDKLLAFSYKPPPAEKPIDGWNIYDARREWKRLGISAKDSEKGWRISEINVDYQYSPTYPALIVVPTRISDNVLNYAGKYRSRARIPALVYRHPINNCSITRSAQPTPGIRGSRNVQDEKLVAAIFATNSGWKPQTAPTSSTTSSSPESSVDNFISSGADSSSVVDPETEDLSDPDESDTIHPKVYGAQQRNMIVDARPTINAMAMQLVGKGSENMDGYKGAQKAYLGIDNIHVMRRSLQKIVDTLSHSDVSAFPPNAEQLAATGWLKHIGNVLEGSALIARTVGIMHSHVLIHCSDGWDRTSQLSALSQICLDPYYRTIDGFIVLVEKDWMSFGHMFRQRSGFLSHEKWFEIENERIAGKSSVNGTSSPSGNPIENATRLAKGFFNRKDESRESLADTTDAEMQNASDSTPASVSTPAPIGSMSGAAEEQRVTKPSEISPVFHQFLDCTYQLLYQHPDRFEYNERFLRRLLYHLYSCQYGTFLFDNEKERVENKAAQRTRSVWDYFLSRRPEFTNPKYDPTVDDSIRGKERMIFPDSRKIRWWPELFGRLDEEMNGKAGPPPGAPAALSPSSSMVSNSSNNPNGLATPSRSGATTPVLADPIVTGVETSEYATGVAAQPKPAASMAQAFASLGIGSGGSSPQPSPQRGRSPRPSREEMEVEMQ
ncbi:phosphatases II [Lophium mytilinum]|uniref:Phosphatases II n=1 Tax=Lophium mytilinum TaxID=390894 RepID=A0A6A6RGL0_9PEZI|nr:phosphatases II [Lophium mytilinum]